jgi:CRP-like cAMP-binding protein
MTDDLSPFMLKTEKGQILFREGDPGDCMYFIHSGKVRIEKDVDGRPEVLAVLEKGDFFGEMAILDQAPRVAGAVIEEAAELLKIDGGNFEKLLKANIEIAVRMIRKYAARLRETNLKLETLLRDRKEMSQGIEEIIHSVKKSPGTTDDLTSPSLVIAELHPAGPGQPIRITQESATIGRVDPVTNIVPDIDLTPLDTGRSVSRRHAKLELVDGQFFLTEEVGVANGTFLGDIKLKPGRPTTVENGSQLRFGNLELRFERKTR